MYHTTKRSTYTRTHVYFIYIHIPFTTSRNRAKIEILLTSTKWGVKRGSGRKEGEEEEGEEAHKREESCRRPSTQSGSTMISSVSHSSLVDLPGLLEKNEERASRSASIAPRRKLWFVAVLISLSSFVFGYSMTALNVAITDDDVPGKIDKDISLSTLMKEIGTALTPIGAFLGCLAGSAPADKYGRRNTLLATSVLFVAGTVVSSVVHNIVPLFVGRLMIGFGVGVESCIVPMYLLEISPEDIRGSISTLHQFAVTIGILISSLIGAAFVTWVDHGWQYVIGLTALPAIVQLVMASSIPESPRWLVLQSKKEAARIALRKILPTLDDASIDAELRQIVNEVQRASKTMEGTSEVTWTNIFESYSKELIVGVTIMSLTAITGVNTVIFYSTDIFKLAGVKTSIIGTISVTATNVLATFVTVKIVEKAGRKFLLTTGMWTMVVPLVAMCVVLLLDIDEMVQGVVAIGSVIIFIIGFAIGLGAVSWVVVSEIVPASIRAKTNGLFVSMNWLINIALCWTLSLIELLGGGSSDDQKKRGVAILYGTFAAITLGGLAFVYTHVRETGASQQLADENKRGLLSNESNVEGDAESDRTERNSVPSFGGDELWSSDNRARGDSQSSLGAPVF